MRKFLRIFTLSFFLFSFSAFGDNVEGFIERLYQNIFEREADSGGLNYWENEIKKTSALSVARRFYKSGEFKSLNLSNKEFLKRSYKTFFDREPDKEGEEYWLKEMENGVLKMQVFYGFAFSLEFKSVCEKYGVLQAASDDRLKAFVERFYNYIFKRDAGDSEINYWFEALKNEEKSPKDVVRFFFFSKEFKSQNVDNREFVKRVYRTIMGREPDKTGENFWIDELKKGKSREYVLDSFLQSEEFERLKDEFMPKISKNAIFVSPSGLDSNDGSEDRPFKTIQKAVNVAKPGDTIYLRGGTYVGRVYIHKSGESGKYITIRNYPGEVPIITRDDKDFYKQTILVEGASYIKIMGLKIDKTTSNALRVQGPGEYIEFVNNEVSYQNEKIPESERVGKAVIFAGYKDKPLRHILIKGNKIHHNHTGRVGYSSEALTISGRVEYFEIKNNKVYDNDFIGIDIIGKTGGRYHYFGNPRYGIISNNEIYGNGKKNKYSSALYFDGGEDILVEKNYIHNNFGPGIAVNQEDKDSFITHIVFRNNVSFENYYNSFGSSTYGGVVKDSIFVHNTLYGTQVYDPSKVKAENLFYLGKGENNVIKNNIFYKNNGYYIMLEVVGRDNNTKWQIDYNGFFPLVSLQNQVIINNTIYKSLEDLKNRSPHSISANDPLLNSDFTLKPNSVCIDSGGFLTFVKKSGSSNRVEVEDARYFTARWKMQKGERVKIGDDIAIIRDVDYDSNVIVLDRNIDFIKGEGVSYEYSGNKPDIGAYEFNQ